MTGVHVALRYDLRCPEGLATVPRSELYRAFLDQAVYADANGVDSIVLSEHHDVDDGYLPSPVPLAAAVAARTDRIPVIVAALLLPLYDPIRLAEDMAVTDLVARGRVSYVCGLGYRREEYEHAGVDWSTRGRRMESHLQVLRQAWTGEPFSYEGREVRVRPRPHTPGGVPLLYGGGSPAAARRAARMGMLLYPQHADPELARVYHEERERLGNGQGYVITPPTRTGTFIVAEDPDRFWAHHGQHLLYEATEYARWQSGMHSAVLDTSTTIEEMREAGVYRVLTPDQMVDEVRSGPAEPLTFHPLIGGLDPDVSWDCLRLLVEDVLPRHRLRRVQSASRACGRSSSNVHPSPPDRRRRSPPWATASARPKARPMPWPGASDRARSCRSKTRARSAGSIPVPRSRTRTTPCPSQRRVATSTAPSPAWSSALRMRLCRISRTASASPRTTTSPPRTGRTRAATVAFEPRRSATTSPAR